MLNILQVAIHRRSGQYYHAVPMMTLWVLGLNNDYLRLQTKLLTLTKLSSQTLEAQGLNAV